MGHVRAAGLTDEAYQDAANLIDENWETVEAVAENLLKYETLNADEVDRLMRGETLDKPTVGDLLSEEAEKLQEPAKKPSESRDDETGPEPGTGPVPAPA